MNICFQTNFSGDLDLFLNYQRDLLSCSETVDIIFHTYLKLTSNLCHLKIHLLQLPQVTSKEYFRKKVFWPYVRLKEVLVHFIYQQVSYLFLLKVRKITEFLQRDRLPIV